jgi:hypothetical protein
MPLLQRKRKKVCKRVLRWELENVPALLSEDGVPSWYDAYDNVEVSEFSDWSEISKWALPLYNVSLTSSEIDGKVDQFKTKNLRLEDQIVATISLFRMKSVIYHFLMESRL